MLLHHRSIRCCLLALVFAGCDMEDGGGETGAASDTAPDTDTDAALDVACEGKPGADECCCFADMGKAVRNACEVETLCETVLAGCADVDGECSVIENPDALACTFAALAGTGRGRVSWSFTSRDNPGSWRHDVDVYLMGDGTAFVFDDSHVDLSGATKGTGRFMLNSSQHWNDCAAATGAREQAGCLRDALMGETQRCGDGFEYTVM